MSADTSKMVIVMRKDLNMRKGKIIAQGSHAAVKAVLQSIVSKDVHQKNNYKKEVEGLHIVTEQPDIFVSDAELDWLTGNYTKICVSVNSEQELLDVYEKAKKVNLNVCLITDAGLTEFQGQPTKTCLAIGPDWSSKIDPITKDLKLL